MSFVLRLLVAAALLICWISVSAFAPTTTWSERRRAIISSSALDASSSSRDRAVRQDDDHFLLQEFRTHKGEILNPYQVLKVSRTAEADEIKTSYYKLSKRYHPDIMRHKDILPGSCNNLDEVRDEWERIKMAYEILKDRKVRKRYDRHEMLSDPNAAMQRAAFDAMGKGIQGIGRGLFDMGARAVKHASKRTDGEREESP